MTQQGEVIRILESHFDKEGWPVDVDRSKLHDRCRITSDAAFPESAVVEIERHRAILGDTYIRGQRMRAFETYYMRYLAGC